MLYHSRKKEGLGEASRNVVRTRGKKSLPHAFPRGKATILGEEGRGN